MAPFAPRPQARPSPIAPKLIKFVPFDPATKMSEATATDAAGSTATCREGRLRRRHRPCPAVADRSRAAAKELEDKGFRVLAVAAGPPTRDEARRASSRSATRRAQTRRRSISELHGLGVRTVMVTGDAPATAAIVAKAVGLDGAVCPPGPIPDGVRPEQFAVFAGVLPEDKYKLVKAFQKGGHTVGMCGDGANDAPALRQAQIGIAVSTATDVAKSAAGMVLTEPGLAGIVAAVKEGRMTFQRILSYTLNSITKKTVQVLFLAIGLRHDRACDPDAAADGPDHDHWRLPRHVVDDRQCPAVADAECLAIGNLTIAGVVMGIGELIFCTAVLAFGALSDGVRHRRPADLGLRRHRVRQSGDDLHQSRASAICGPPAPASGSSLSSSPIS